MLFSFSVIVYNSKYPLFTFYHQTVNFNLLVF